MDDSSKKLSHGEFEIQAWGNGTRLQIGVNSFAVLCLETPRMIVVFRRRRCWENVSSHFEKTSLFAVPYPLRRFQHTDAFSRWPQFSLGRVGFVLGGRSFSSEAGQVHNIFVVCSSETAHSPQRAVKSRTVAEKMIGLRGKCAIPEKKLLATNTAVIGKKHRCGTVPISIA